MFKHILFDADGVVLKRRKYFSEIYAEEHGLDALSDMLPFFKGDFQKCVTGQADLLEVVKPWLKPWKWEKSAEEFLQYWFKLESDIQNDVLEYIATLRKDGVKAYLASQQEMRRGEYMLNTLGLKDKFDGYFLTFEMGLYKDDPQFFKVVLDKLGVQPDEVLFVDDEQENLDAAAQTGIKTHFFKSLAELKQTF